MNKEIKLERVQKLLSQAGVASRRNAETLLKAGKVLVNGKIAQLGDKASFDDKIVINGKNISQQAKVYYLINKPQRTICTLKDPQGRQIITDLIADKRFIFPIGRLDYNTTGTLLLTNDGELANRLAHPVWEIVRIYRCRIDRPLTTKDLLFLNSDQVLIDGKQSLQTVQQVDHKTYTVSLKQGSYHHVKKLFEINRRTVQNLTRIEFAGLSHVGKLQKGAYRQLTSKEVETLKKMVKMEV